MLVVLKYFGLAFSALLPVINPLGSALVFLTVVGNVPSDQFRYLARKVAVSMVLFLLVFEGGGAALLHFFGISLPVVQLAGGFVLAAMGWGILEQSDRTTEKSATPVHDVDKLDEKIFYPLTFPISAGPACIVVTLTLSAHASGHDLITNVLAHLGIAVAIAVLGVAVWLCYAYAPRITQKVTPATVHGILRVVAFILLCIGVQIASKGVETMMKNFAK